MRVKAIGVQRMKGIGKESGKPYDFAQVLYLRKIEPTSSEKFTIQGLGYEVGKLDMATDAMHKFNDVQFPADLDLATENQPGRNGIKVIVTGFTAQERNQPKAVA